MRRVFLWFTPFALAVNVATAWMASAHVGNEPNHQGASYGPDWRSLNGYGNNQLHPEWGMAGTPYSRVARALYGDGVGSIAKGPSERFVSNRIFNDVGQNIFSNGRLSQWAWVWGQFMDHTFGLADDGSEKSPIAFRGSDPLESFRNDFGSISFSRDEAAPGSGSSSWNPRQQINTVSSYIDAWNVYGGTKSRLEWLREGPVNHWLGDNGPHLLLSADGYLPRADARGDPANAPEMKVDGRLLGTPNRRVEAGDVRANENVALTALHSLFAREHNRIVDALPDGLSSELKFQIARRVVGAEEQWITYHEFLPAMGVWLPPYQGYDPNVDASLSNEFATVGYRAHSQVHGEFDIEVASDRYSADELAAFERQGVMVEDQGDTVQLEVPLGAAFFNPDLLEAIGLNTFLSALGDGLQYRNDEQIDNSMRSVLFQVPGPQATDPAACFDFEVPPTPECFQGVVDLGALDIRRGRDHGIPTYNELRRAYGLRPVSSFREITGEGTESFPRRGVSRRDPINDPRILDFVELRDADGNLVEPGSDESRESVVKGIRRTTVSARLRAIYGSVDRVDAFAGMVSERHVPGTEFGPLQLAMWQRQFRALRDGDRFFFANDPVLRSVYRQFGIDFRMSLADVIRADGGVPPDDVSDDVFFVPG